jgi:uncharacterized membrane protein
MPWTFWFEALLAGLAVALALALKPWRALPPGGPPWPWLAWWAVLPLLWGVDGHGEPQGQHLGPTPALSLAQPLSGACLLMLMAGWPLAVLALLPAAALTGWLAGLPPEVALQRGVWLGLVPATLAMLIGAGLRRWLPTHLFIYILGRGFFATAIAGSLAAFGDLLLHAGPASLQQGDLMLARFLTAWGDAFITGMLTAIFVAYRPHWLATYADRLYLGPPHPR